MSPRLAEILTSAPETKCLELGFGAIDRTAAAFERYFHGRTPMVVADPITLRVAGERLMTLLKLAGHEAADSFVFTDPGFHAELGFVTRLEKLLEERPEMVPIAVGSGTINDVTKLAAHHAQRRYLTVATAASMDGYTAFGASITDQGAKQTWPCAAPLVVIADLALIAGGPSQLNAAGYADLLAKVPAGADWILADALEVESVHHTAWELVQENLRPALADPAGLAAGNAKPLEALTQGLLLSGFAMQFASSSRPASGAEHQFSHLWDMQHHTFQGTSPLHGYKVAIGTLAVTALYEFLLEQPLEKIRSDCCCEHWPDPSELERAVRNEFPEPQLASVALTESRAKHIDKAVLGKQLTKLREVWPRLRDRVRQQLISFERLKRMLRQAGAPTEPEELGLTRVRLRDSFRSAYYIRRRFTVLDLAVRVDMLEKALDHIFGPSGPWPTNR